MQHSSGSAALNDSCTKPEQQHPSRFKQGYSDLFTLFLVHLATVSSAEKNLSQ